MVGWGWLGLAVLFGAAVVPCASAAAEPVAIAAQAYTNHAGHVIVGELVRADARTATFRLVGGTSRIVPLSVFPPAERERIGIASGTLVPPPAVAVALERCRQALQRLDVLVKAGQQSVESAEKSRELERRAVQALIADQEKDGKLSPTAAAYFMKRVP